ncbi:MAG TPA: hypothetical protein VJQ26_11795, partial [Ktedonobacteraceae bacterium]|nr:hypothetical protein [Ktedonobacteraceae bacterium]
NGVYPVHILPCVRKFFVPSPLLAAQGTLDATFQKRWMHYTLIEMNKQHYFPCRLYSSVKIVREGEKLG